MEMLTDDIEWFLSHMHFYNSAICMVYDIINF